MTVKKLKKYVAVRNFQCSTNSTLSFGKKKKKYNFDGHIAFTKINCSIIISDVDLRFMEESELDKFRNNYEKLHSCEFQILKGEFLTRQWQRFFEYQSTGGTSTILKLTNNGSFRSHKNLIRSQLEKNIISMPSSASPYTSARLSNYSGRLPVGTLYHSQGPQHTEIIMNNTAKNIASMRSPRNSAIGYMPNFDDTIFGTTGDDIIVMRAPGYIQYRTFVTSDQRMICCDSPRL